MLLALIPGAAHAQDAAYLPESWDLEVHDRWIVGTTLFATDETTAVPELPRDLLWGLSVAHRWSWFELGTVFAAGLNFIDGVEQMRLYAALTPRVAIPIADLGFLDFEITYGVGISGELKQADDYMLMHVTPAEIGLLVWDRGSWHLTVFGSLRILAATLRMDGLVGQTGAIYPEVTDAQLAKLEERRFGFTAGIGFTREL